MWRSSSGAATRLLPLFRHRVCSHNNALLQGTSSNHRNLFRSSSVPLLGVSRVDFFRSLTTTSPRATTSTSIARRPKVDDSWRIFKSAMAKCVTSPQLSQFERVVMDPAAYFVIQWDGQVVPWRPSASDDTQKSSKEGSRKNDNNKNNKKVLLFQLKELSDPLRRSFQATPRDANDNPVVVLDKTLVTANLLTRYAVCRNHKKVVALFQKIEHTKGFAMSVTLQEKYLTALFRLRRYDEMLEYFQRHCTNHTILASNNLCNLLLMAARISKRGDWALEIMNRLRTTEFPLDSSVYQNALLTVLHFYPNTKEGLANALEIYEFMVSHCGFVLRPQVWSTLGSHMLKMKYPVDQLCTWLDTYEVNHIPLFGTRMTNLCTAPLCRNQQDLAFELVKHCASSFGSHDQEGCARFLSSVMWSVLREGATIQQLETYAALLNEYNAPATASVVSKTFEVYLNPKNHPTGTSRMKIVYDLFVMWDRNPVAFALSPFAVFKAVDQCIRNKWIDECDAVVKYATERDTVLYVDTLDHLFRFYADHGEFYRIVTLAEQVLGGAPNFTEAMFESLLKAYFHMEEYAKVVELNTEHELTTKFPKNTTIRTIVWHAREHASA